MIQPANQPVDNSTLAEKVIACLSGFGFACAAFFFAAIVLIPLTGSLATTWGLPEAVTGSLILLEMFGLTVVAGIYGVAVTAGRYAAEQNDQGVDRQFS